MHIRQTLEIIQIAINSLFYLVVTAVFIVFFIKLYYMLLSGICLFRGHKWKHDIEGGMFVTCSRCGEEGCDVS